MILYKQEEIEEIVRQNIDKVHIGEVFSSRRELYRKLNIEVNDNNKNVIEKVVTTFIGYDNLSGRSIKIGRIDDQAKIIDGRTNNKGANNIKYQAMVCSAVLDYMYDCSNYEFFLTNNKMYTKVLEISTEYIDDSEDDSFNIRQYKEIFRSYLLNIMKSGIEKLLKEKLIYAEKIHVTKSVPMNMFNLQTFNEHTRFCDIVGHNYFCLLNDSLRSIGYNTLTETDTVLSVYEWCNNDKELSCVLYQTMRTIFDFETIIYDNENSEQTDCFEEKYHACLEFQDFFKSINTLVDHITRKKYYNQSDRNYIYRVRKQICNMFGFDKTISVWHIKAAMQDRPNVYGEYCLCDLLEVMEDSFIKKLNNTYYKRQTDTSEKGLKNLCDYFEAEDIIAFHTKLFKSRKIKNPV